MGQLFELDGGPHGDGCDMAILRGRRGGGWCNLDVKLLNVGRSPQGENNKQHWHGHGVIFWQEVRNMITGFILKVHETWWCHGISGAECCLLGLHLLVISAPECLWHPTYTARASSAYCVYTAHFTAAAQWWSQRGQLDRTQQIYSTLQIGLETYFLSLLHSLIQKTQEKYFFFNLGFHCAL